MATVGPIRIVLDRVKVKALEHDAELVPGLERAARGIATNVRQQGAPATNLRARRGGGGRFVAGAVQVGESGHDATSRYATVATSDPGWHLIEYGTWSVPAFAPFRAGVEASGCRFIDRGPSS